MGLANWTYVMPPVSDLDEVYIIPRLTAGFHVQLRVDNVVSRRTFMELNSFHQVTILLDLILSVSLESGVKHSGRRVVLNINTLEEQITPGRTQICHVGSLLITGMKQNIGI